MRDGDDKDTRVGGEEVREELGRSAVETHTRTHHVAVGAEPPTSTKK